jgi:hypothetical protein
MYGLNKFPVDCQRIGAFHEFGHNSPLNHFVNIAQNRRYPAMGNILPVFGQTAAIARQIGKADHFG